MQRIVRTSLIGDHIWAHAAFEKLGENISRIAEQAHRFRFARLGPAVDHLKRFVKRVGAFVDVFGAQAEVDAVGVTLNSQTTGTRHHGCQGLRAAHTTQTTGQDPFACKIAVVMLAACLDECLVGALNDALAADVNPRPRGHLAVHCQTLFIELVEMIPSGPMRHEVGIGDQHTRRIAVGFDDGNGFAGLHNQRFIILQILEAGNDTVKVFPCPRRSPDATIDHQFMRVFSHIRVQVIHQHPQRCLCLPAFCV